MVGESRLLSTLAKLVKRAKADGVSISAHAKSRRVFRFANEAIHQDLTQENVTVAIKVICANRIGIASADTLDEQSLARCLRSATEIARHAPKQDVSVCLPSKHRIRVSNDYVNATAELKAIDCVIAIKHLFRLCKGAGAQLAGSLMMGEDEFAVVNSSNVSCYAASTVTAAKLVTMYLDLSGYASGVERDFNRLDLDGLLMRSLSQSLHKTKPINLPNGLYEVILEPEAVAELITWLGYIAFGAKSVQERTSFLAGRMDEHLMDFSITIYDDGNETESLRMPFDFEGSPKQKVALIDHGRAAGIVYDTMYGSRFGQPSSGHAMSPDEVDGPLPLNLAIEPGQSSLDDMISSCERGVLIPRFHYVNGLLNPRKALMTGLTREGAFLIEAGKAKKPISTMRFTQSLLEAFKHVRAVSRERRLIADPAQELGCALVPALQLIKFKFTGRSES